MNKLLVIAFLGFTKAAKMFEMMNYIKTHHSEIQLQRRGSEKKSEDNKTVLGILIRELNAQVIDIAN